MVQIPTKIISKYLLFLCNQDQAITDNPAKKKRRVKAPKIVDMKTSFSTPASNLHMLLLHSKFFHGSLI
jgi:hypothetical protein